MMTCQYQAWMNTEGSESKGSSIQNLFQIKYANQTKQSWGPWGRGRILLFIRYILERGSTSSSLSTACPGRRGGGLNMETPTLFPATSATLPLATQVVPQPTRRHRLPSISWVCPGASSPLGMPETPPQGRCPGGILSRCLSRLNWFLSIRGSSTPSSSRMTELNLSPCP